MKSARKGEGDVSDRRHTTKQMGDAGEMLVAAELTLHGVPALRAPDFWPEYDVIAQPIGQGRDLQKISVKTRTQSEKSNLIRYYDTDIFDWLAIVILPGDGCNRRRIFIVPRDVADQRAGTAIHKSQSARCFWVRNVTKSPSDNRHGLADYEDNYTLQRLAI